MTIWLFGDSVLQGGVLRRAAAGWPAPARMLSRPTDVLSLLVGRESGARWGATTNLSEAPEKCVLRLEEVMGSGEIEEGDSLVFLDVGEHGRDPDAHERRWRWIIETVVAEHPVHLVVCEGFDNGAEWLAERGSVDPRKLDGLIECLYDLRFGDRSHNEALRAAARPSPDYAGEVTWLPLSEHMAEFQKDCVDRFGATAYRDPVHPNVWGQLRLCALVLTAIPEEPAFGADATAQRFCRHWRALGAASREAAEGIVGLALAESRAGAVAA